MGLRERLRRRLRDTPIEAASGVTLAPDAEAMLASMYAWEPQAGAGGALHALDGRTRVSRPRGLLAGSRAHRAGSGC